MAEFKLGQPVETTSVLGRVTIAPEGRGDVRREWHSNPTRPRRGVVVGIRHLQNGRIIDQHESDGYGYTACVSTSWACDSVVPAVLVAYDIRQTPQLTALEDVKAVHVEHNEEDRNG